MVNLGVIPGLEEVAAVIALLAAARAALPPPRLFLTIIFHRFTQWCRYRVRKRSDPKLFAGSESIITVHDRSDPDP